MDPKKMPMQTLSDIYKKYRLYLILSNRLAKTAIILLLEFVLSLKSYEIKILTFKIGFTILS